MLVLLYLNGTLKNWAKRLHIPEEIYQKVWAGAFFLPINSSSPSIQVLSTELQFVSVIGNRGNCSAPLRTLRKWKSENSGYVLFRGDEMSGEKVVLSELGVGCWIPACWRPSCRGKCGSWLRQQEQGKYLCNYHTTCCWVKPSGWCRIFTTMHFFTIILITEAIGSDVGFPAGLDGKKSACNVGDPGFDPCLGKIPWSRAWQPTSVFLPGESQ